MNGVWTTDVDTMIKIFELGQAHGKKPGESCQEEFDEIRAQFPKKFTFLGTTNKDIDLLTGDLRENGLKILNMNEIKKNDNQTDNS